KQLPLPPQTERCGKAKSQARSDRVDQVNILFDWEPGIENMRADETEIGQRADDSQRRLRNLRPSRQSANTRMEPRSLRKWRLRSPGPKRNIHTTARDIAMRR